MRRYQRLSDRQLDHQQNTAIVKLRRVIVAQIGLDAFKACQKLETAVYETLPRKCV